MVLTAASVSTVTAQQLLETQRMTVKESAACGLPVEKVTVKRSADLMTVGMNMNLSDFEMKGDRVAVFAPVLVNGADSLTFDPVGLYSRIRYIQYMRYGEHPVGGENEDSYRYADRPDMIEYSQTVPYAEWMNGATLYMQRCDYGCCHTLIDEQNAPLAGWREIAYTPVYYYVTPTAEAEKMRELSGRAYVDFPVNRTEIHTEYRNNPVELAKIIATIDSVRNDKDITVKSLSIKGFASPEGPYDNNVRLAKGRTEALKNYVQQLYMFPYGFIQTSYEPEDWEGLREYVVNSTMPSKMGILAIIDSYMAPDPKNTKIQTDYPQEYEFLLQTVYPGLRHSDYRIEYDIRGFSDIAEIAELMRTHPSKLSLNEMYLLASTLVPGTPEYNEVMETAVKMFPTDEVAILNAATAAMQRDDLNQAERYLAKASNTAEALYTRGVLAGLQKDYSKATWYMEQAVAKGHPQAAAELEKIKEAKQYSK